MYLAVVYLNFIKKHKNKYMAKKEPQKQPKEQPKEQSRKEPKRQPKKISLEKRLFPQSETLIENEGSLTAIIVDMELDPIECEFYGDGCVIIHTGDYDYIVLTPQNLTTLKRLIKQADKIYETMEFEETEEDQALNWWCDRISDAEREELIIKYDLKKPIQTEDIKKVWIIETKQEKL